MDIPGADLLMNTNMSTGDLKLPELESISLPELDSSTFLSAPVSSGSSQTPQLVPSASDIGPTKSWDGVENLNADAYLKPVHSTPVMSEDAIMKEKYELLRKFERLQKLGVPIRKKFTMESPIEEIKMELEFIRKEKAMDATIKQFSEWFITGMSAMEWGSKNINALKMFGLQLDGLSQSAQMNVGDYEEDFEELYDLYGDKMRMHPLVRIPMRTCMMVYMVHLTNQMAMKAPVPNIQEILRQNPDIGRQLASEAMKGQTQQFKQQAQQQATQPSYSPPPKPQQNALSGLMSFLGGTQQPPPQQTSVPMEPSSRKVTMPSKSANITLPTMRPPPKELPPPSGMGIPEILKTLTFEEKKPSPPSPMPKSALKKSGTSTAGKSPKNSVVIKL